MNRIQIFYLVETFYESWGHDVMKSLFNISEYQ